MTSSTLLKELDVACSELGQLYLEYKSVRTKLRAAEKLVESLVGRHNAVAAVESAFRPSVPLDYQPCNQAISDND